MHRIVHNIALAFFVTTVLAAHAFSQAVEFKLQQKEGWIGTPLTMQVVTVNTNGDSQPPEIAISPDFVSAVVGAPQKMDMRQSINGVASRRLTTTWIVQMTPQRAGLLPLPQVKIVCDGRTYLSPAQNFLVAAAESADVLAVSVRSDPTTLYAGQTADLILEIAIHPYVNREHDVALGERQMWELIDKGASSWGVFEPRMRELVQSAQRPTGREEVRNGARWFIYEIVAKSNASRSGALDFGDVKIDVRYPTGISVNRDFFGATELSISGIRKVSVSPAAAQMLVKALPEVGKPASFRGAVGKFAIESSVKPSKAAVGDPMTLTLSITSLTDNADDLRSLQPPPLESPAMTQRFRMPTDPLAGTIDGTSKTFTQTLRALSADVKEIPPIEFSYFDPSTAKYVTTSTQTISVSISPAERVSASAMDGLNATKKDSAKVNLTEVNGGLFANAAPGVSLIEDQRLIVGWTTGLLCVCPPLLALLLLLVRKRGEFANKNIAAARSRGAAKQARQQLQSTQDIAEIARILQWFVEARTGRSVGTVARNETSALAKQAGAQEELLAQLDSILSLGERSAFAFKSAESAQETREKALKIIAVLDTLSWKRKTKSIFEELHS